MLTAAARTSKFNRNEWFFFSSPVRNVTLIVDGKEPQMVTENDENTVSTNKSMFESNHLKNPFVPHSSHFFRCVCAIWFICNFLWTLFLSLLLALFTFRWMALNKTLINTPCGGNKKFYFEWDSAPCCAVCKSECTKLNCWRFFFFSRFFFFFFFWKSHSRKFPFVKYYLHWNQESVEKSHRVCLSMM